MGRTRLQKVRGLITVMMNLLSNTYLFLLLGSLSHLSLLSRHHTLNVLLKRISFRNHHCTPFEEYDGAYLDESVDIWPMGNIIFSLLTGASSGLLCAAVFVRASDLSHCSKH